MLWPGRDFKFENNTDGLHLKDMYISTLNTMAAVLSGKKPQSILIHISDMRPKNDCEKM